MMSEPDYKKCTRCKEWLPISKFRRMGVKKGKQQYEGPCKPCRPPPERSPEQKERHRKYLKARGRALSRLSHLVPELYDMCLEEEMVKEGLTFHPRTDPKERRSIKLPNHHQ